MDRQEQLAMAEAARLRLEHDALGNFPRLLDVARLVLAAETRASLHIGDQSTTVDGLRTYYGARIKEAATDVNDELDRAKAITEAIRSNVSSLRQLVTEYVTLSATAKTNLAVVRDQTVLAIAGNSQIVSANRAAFETNYANNSITTVAKATQRVSSTVQQAASVVRVINQQYPAAASVNEANLAAASTSSDIGAAQDHMSEASKANGDCVADLAELASKVDVYMAHFIAIRDCAVGIGMAWNCTAIRVGRIFAMLDKIDSIMANVGDSMDVAKLPPLDNVIARTDKIAGETEAIVSAARISNQAARDETTETITSLEAAATDVSRAAAALQRFIFENRTR